ncbi:bifunctional Delta(1)-pyrroline-2-carboxylate/Delta(1)-piperideine-2-carboxylate reductase [Ornithinimicrobium avium]|uniref:Ornithine cyclodeaminase family protein n=1 Tax=Ornithinimicrobium avium TaxID=2283195 RepID=A0A345NK34_9MICO|nr:ornithine cyclodeaminase family protein [Ornithinimicrobium avium]AXH95392.1 ornithine cyclodeaminase family protein [Ornithinimicrobium avium]
MELLDAARIRAVLQPGALVEALRTAFAHQDDVVVPDRGHHRVDEDRQATLLVMPAWESGRWIGVKVVAHFPHNGERGLPAIQGSYLLTDGTDGRPVAVLDGAELTRWRTAAASALAADSLAPREVGEHLLIGAGNVAAALPHCYAAVREVGLTRVWARSARRAAELVERLRQEGLAAEVAEDLREGVRRADVVSAATSSTSPLVLAQDVRPGTHVDLIGAFTPAMHEADEALITSASLFVDVEAALHEPGEIVDALERGTLTRADVRGTLSDLAARRHTGRSSSQEVTVFESVGTALEDLVAAALVWQAHSRV